MDLKATALLKLIYLEMFGHDMSWASFHVLEVMSCPKYLQKRVGYLAAVQSFRPDTEVLMLATNLLKKVVNLETMKRVRILLIPSQDISSPLAPTMSLPLVALPHIITSSLALSLLSDLLPRLAHSTGSVRKKTVAALYRLALVYPDTLRSAWPKIKDILLDEEEDSSVTAAVVNVVCELGWRRPRDFLSLAPRLFDLLIEGGNNWMAIKIIKLFAIFTPLEPRLVKKLLPPLTNLIRTTPAMSLLYECINGIIQGGILEGSDGATEGEEIASLCVNKLRGMIVIEGDPNLKYVALLAFNRIVESHPHLVSMQQDVIMSCLDDPDISIRLQALDLGTGIVNSDNLVTVVERLIQQLRNAPVYNGIADDERGHALGVEPAADSDGEDPEEALRPTRGSPEDKPALPTEYRITVIRQILQMCCKDTYANVADFDWYIEILMQLIKLIPVGSQASAASTDRARFNAPQLQTAQEDLSVSVGWELRNVAVRVNTVRAKVVQAANTLIKSFRSPSSSSALGVGSEGVLQYAAWVLGEYAGYCVSAHDTLDALLVPRAMSLPFDVICAYLQAIPKVFTHIVSKQSSAWNQERKTMMSLLLSRIIKFLEPLSTHPNLEVQQRAVEFLELMRIASQAISSDGQVSDQAPLLLTRAIPELFTGFELNPVAPSAQRKVPVPDGLDLDTPINGALPGLLQSVGYENYGDSDSAEFDSFYNKRPIPKSLAGPALNVLPLFETGPSYQQAEDILLNPEALVKKRIVRRERNKDDPFYIGADDISSGTSSPFHEVLKNSNGDIVDVDSIPIMSLDLGDKGSAASHSDVEIKQPRPRRPKKVHIVKDETIGHDDESQTRSLTNFPAPNSKSLQQAKDKGKKSLLKVDSSSLGSFSLTSNPEDLAMDSEQGLVSEDSEMAKALAEVERLRLEMQRASERIQASDGTPAEGTLVKKKKNKKKKAKQLSSKDAVDSTQGRIEQAEMETQDVGVATVVRKKKKKRKVPTISIDDGNEETVSDER